MIIIGISALVMMSNSAFAASLELGTTNGILKDYSAPTSSITIYNASCKVWSYTTGSSGMGTCVVKK